MLAHVVEVVVGRPQMGLAIQEETASTCLTGRPEQGQELLATMPVVVVDPDRPVLQPMGMAVLVVEAVGPGDPVETRTQGRTLLALDKRGPVRVVEQATLV